LARQQIEAHQQRCTDMEVAMKQACTRQEQAEQKLQEEIAERTRLCGEAARLQEQIEAQYKMVGEMKEGLRMASEKTHTENQRVQWLEDRLQDCQEEIEALRRCQPQAAAVGAVGPPVTVDAPSLQAATPQTGETRRRLFPSLADATQAQAAQTNTNSTASSEESSSHEQWTSASGAVEMSRGRALTAPSRGPPSSSQAPPPIAGFMSRCTSSRLHESRAASSAPRSGRSAAPPGRLGHAHSAGDLVPHRSASCDGFANLSRNEEAPPPGCVADKVTIFEQRCRTPMPERPERRNCRMSRDDGHTRATPPALPRGAPAAAAPRSPQDVAAQLAQLGSHGSGTAPSERSGRRLPKGLEMPLEDDEQDGPGEHVVFGMSPMAGCRLLEPPSSSNLIQVGTFST